MNSRHFFVIVGLSLLLLGSNLNAQNGCSECDKIRHNPNYYWADSPGEYVTFAEAREAAIHILTGNISQYIESFFSDTVSKQMTSSSMDYSKTTFSTLKSYSNVILDELTVIELSPEPQAKVFCYVEKSKVKTIFDERKNQVLDFVESGMLAERDLQVDDALRFYYWALMLAKTLPENIPITVGGRTGNALTLLPIKIRAVLSGIDCTVVSIEENEYGEQELTLDFKYCEMPVASSRYKYFNGSNFAGPIFAKDGHGEAVLIDMPPDGKLKISFEYRFQDEAKQILPAVFENTSAVIFKEAQREYPIKMEKKKKQSKRKDRQETSSVATNEVAPEVAEAVKTLEKEAVQDNTEYEKAMMAIENAIKKQSPELAYSYMTPECYKLFQQLLKKTGKLSLSKQKEYDYIVANNQVLARYMYVKLQVDGGKTFMDKLVFRFSPQDKKIQSFAFGLTEKAENDIFDAAKSWSNISRYTILGFMEDYQTAYALKQLDYIERIFSDDALIIVGHELQSVKTKQSDKIEGQLESERKVAYNKMTKQEYLERLKGIFSSNAYVHLSFEDNVTKVLNTNGRLPNGAAFGIQIKQIYSSSRYSDRGYLTLMLNMMGEYPMIVVRYWQPTKETIIDMGDFFSSDNFEW